MLSNMIICNSLLNSDEIYGHRSQADVAEFVLFELFAESTGDEEKSITLHHKFASNDFGHDFSKCSTDLTWLN